MVSKRKGRGAKSLDRKSPKREPYNLVLIVCEGAKTEPNYFKAMINDLRLSTANVEVADNRVGSDPISVVKFAIERFEEAKRKGEPYDKVFCIFDKDKHLTYDEAIDIINRRRGNVFQAVTSVPCFEVWILLHFEYKTRSFSTSGSDCDLVVKKIRDNYIPSYSKGSENIYEEIKGKRDVAISRAKKLEEYCESVATDNPSTKVYELVEYLQRLKPN